MQVNAIDRVAIYNPTSACVIGGAAQADTAIVAKSHGSLLIVINSSSLALLVVQ